MMTTSTRQTGVTDMTKVQHTPGPWKYDPKTGLVAHDEYDEIGFSGVATIHQPYEATPERQANASLIAAAPDLLAALLPLVEASPVGGGMIRFDGDELAAARAAIAKAKGA